MFEDSKVVYDLFLSIGVVSFALTSALTVYFALRFRKVLTHAIILFYVVTTLTLSLRTVFFISILVEWTIKTRAILLVLPGAFTLGIGMTQVNVYL